VKRNCGNGCDGGDSGSVVVLIIDGQGIECHG